MIILNLSNREDLISIKCDEFKYENYRVNFYKESILVASFKKEDVKSVYNDNVVEFGSVSTVDFEEAITP